jgi:hypothetical protein
MPGPRSISTPSLAERAVVLRRAVDVDRLLGDVAALAGPRSRVHAAGAISRAEAWIANALCQAGWQTDRRPFVWSGPADMSIGGPIQGINVLARRRAATSGSNGTILVGAHYDTVEDSPGADDNGSGVAALLELARVLSDHRFGHDVVLCAFDLEEPGFFGARALISELRHHTDTAPGSQRLPPGVAAVFRAQVRTLRRYGFRGDWTLVAHRASSTALARCFAETLIHLAGPDTAIVARDPVDLPLLGGLLARLVPWSRDFARSDHVPFWEAGIPAIQITDTANFRNPHYHRPTDTPETLDYGRIAAIVAAVGTVVVHLADDFP